MKYEGTKVKEMYVELWCNEIREASFLRVSVASQQWWHKGCLVGRFFINVKDASQKYNIP